MRFIGVCVCVCVCVRIEVSGKSTHKFEISTKRRTARGGCCAAMSAWRKHSFGSVIPSQYTCLQRNQILSPPHLPSTPTTVYSVIGAFEKCQRTEDGESLCEVYIEYIIASVPIYIYYIRSVLGRRRAYLYQNH